MTVQTRLSKKVIIGISCCILLLGLGSGVYFYQTTRPAVKGEQAPPPVPQKVTNLLKDVGKKTPLPAAEVPTIATITDLSKMDQAFFLKAEKGDKILMYINAKQAYLYRPSTDQIINQGFLEIIYEDDTASESAETVASESAKQDTSVLRVTF